MDGRLFVLLLLSGLFWNSSGLTRPYHYINTAMSWSEAQSYCRERFTDLATVDSIDDVNRLINKVDAGYSGSVWIGLKKGTLKHWIWSNGDNTTQYYNWGSGKPVLVGDCVATMDGVWANIPCNFGRYYVCYGNSGYTLVKNPLTWAEARSYCRQFYTDLAFIHNWQENVQVASLISGWSLWFGMFADSWEWSDQWDLRYRHWAAGQPSMTADTCVGMSTTNSGKWSQQSCDVLQPFICYGGTKTPQVTEYINTAMSWSEAQSYCRERFTDLATVDSTDDVNRLINKVDAGYSGSVWIGLKKGTLKHWIWSNGDNTTQYYNWGSGQPKGDGDCVTTFSGVWYDAPCIYTRHFVCYGNSGYTLVQRAKTWSDARSYCRQHHTDLPTVHNLEENNQMKKILLSGWHFWFGLFLDSWEWSDQWDLRFRHWAADQPSMTADACVGMSATDSGKWSQERCDRPKPFICYGDDKRQQIVRLKVTCNGKCTLNDHSLQTAILKEVLFDIYLLVFQINEKLKDMRLESDSTISWRKGEDGEVFHQENNHDE
ncbi:macrophage mannose receptor 1-like [Garra rufa]|uniref:macrophage mannose receptor 1-like n=1 Tax=Garra rufa TaxID=137080 RepID=UPI003CCE93E7